MNKNTLVIGASENPSRYSHFAVNLLKQHDIPVSAIGNKAGRIGETEIKTGLPALSGIHTVTLYLSAVNQKKYYDYIIGLNPERVIFNPGTENPEFYILLDEKNIAHEEACTLVLLNTGNY